MQEIIDFLDELSANNDRTWFEANRERYKSVKQRMDSVAEEFIEAIAAFDSSIEGLRAKDCTYRIYRDTRFQRINHPIKRGLAYTYARAARNRDFRVTICTLSPTKTTICSAREPIAPLQAR